MFQRDLFIGDHHTARLFRMGPGADAQMVIGRGQMQILKDRTRHVAVIMLAGVDENRREILGRGQSVPERRHLHQVRPRGRDQMNNSGHAI